MPVGQYIQRRRITRAAILLRLTNLTISAISEKLLYDSQQTFTREFKKNTGYTPLQYRKEKKWTFKNQTGSRTINKELPAPVIELLKEKPFHGKCIISQEKIPYSATRTSNKWRMIENQLSKEKSELFISNDIINGNDANNTFFINSVIWTSEETSEFSATMSGGLYAVFSFKGQIEDYSHHINNIYLNVLPYYALQKKNTFDLEIISTCSNGDFKFKYYLPIECDSSDFPLNNAYSFPSFSEKPKIMF